MSCAVSYQQRLQHLVIRHQCEAAAVHVEIQCCPDPHACRYARAPQPDVVETGRTDRDRRRVTGHDRRGVDVEVEQRADDPGLEQLKTASTGRRSVLDSIRFEQLMI